MFRGNFFLFLFCFCFLKVWFGLYFVLYSTYSTFFKYILDSIKVIWVFIFVFAFVFILLY